MPDHLSIHSDHLTQFKSNLQTLPTKQQIFAKMPNNADFPSYAGRGCGCCAHCRCTGACGSIDRKAEPDQLTPPSSQLPARAKTPAPAPAQFDDKDSVLNGPAYNKSLWSTLESLPHPNDLIMGRNSSRKEMLLSPEPLTPFMATSQAKSAGNKTPQNPVSRVPSSVALNNGQNSPPLPNLPKKEKRGEESKSHKRQANGDDSANAFPGSKPNARLPSRKGLPDGGLSIDVPKTKSNEKVMHSDEEGTKRSKSKQSSEHKSTKAKVRNLSRKSKKVESEDESETEEASDEDKAKRSKKKKHKEHIEEPEPKLSHKSSKMLNRKSSQHWKEEQKSAKAIHDSEEETVKSPVKPKVCRKCSVNTLAKLKLAEEHQQSGEGKGRDWTQTTPQLGTFHSPRYDRSAFQDADKVQEEIILQQLQRQRDREWEREQERERESFAREIAQRGHSDHGGRKGKSSKTHSPSVDRQGSRHSLNSGRKMVSSSDNDDDSEEDKSSDEEEEVVKKHKKHRKKKSRSSRNSKKQHSDTEEETNTDEETKARKSRRSKSSKSKKHYETSPTSEEAEEVHQKQSDTSQEDEEDVVEMKSSKKTKRKPKELPNAIMEEDEERFVAQSPSKEKIEPEPLKSSGLDRNNLGPNVAEPQELKHTISIGNFSITRTRTVKPLKEFGSSPALRSLAKMDQDKEEDSAELKRDKLKKILDSKMKDAKTLNAKSSFAMLSSGPKSAKENKLQNEALIIPKLRSMPSLSTFNATKKLIVQHAPASEPNTIYFIDMTHMDEQGNPLVAFRLHADPMADSSDVKLNKKGHDWLMQSHETGSKLKSRLWLSAGRDGPVMFVIDIKSRRVDKFIIQGAPGHLKKFTDSPSWGTHEDYRHLYCQSPEKKQLKWFIQEPGKLMRLFGRSEEDHGHVYAEARLANVAPTKKNRRTTKEAALCFYDPTKETDKSDSPLQMDIGYLCCTWFCARQTYDEGQFAAAHAEVEMIENIEKAFEVDLLAGA
ncbi:uncharacterized protein FA14DRAFT_171288 [Meira miltonrushii]|uniref:Uncharacterized protein n=1 Tax=Meira miltonrushii TaxID=1280837 RepID=A0A316VAA9_9BASI|nr:uncharacterized protein FA14DRAFT_171288 [Meira miltonrushii]PWN34507.1 hypothetical protein FA14DRAFT_171288 [Meira miltonrushii]